MAETQFNYSVFDSGNEVKTNSDTSNNTLSKTSKSHGENRRISFKKSTVYVIAIVAAIVCVCNGIVMYLIASREQDCKCILPDGYQHSASRGRDITKNMSAKFTKQSDCPPKWLYYDQSCYFFSNESTSWLDAMIHCMKFGGYLAEIYSAEEDEFLRSQVKQTSGKECYSKTSDRYNGTMTTTFKGRVCQRWDSQFPHKHTRNDISRFPDTSISDAENYCRDPDKEGMPWCYTTDLGQRWQFCGIYKCPGTYWIGMSDQTKESPWTWVSSGTPITYSSYKNWASGEPSNKGGKFEHCGAITGASNLSWSDQNCFGPALFICEI